MAGTEKSEAEKSEAAKSVTVKAGAVKTGAVKASAAKADAPKKTATKTATTAPTKAATKTETKAPAAKAAAVKAPAKTAAANADDTAAAPKKTAVKAGAKKAVMDEAPARPQVLKMHHLRPAPGAKKGRMRVGRGEGSKGKTAGRGTKGTKARYSMRPGFEGGNINFVMRAPKLRGFKNPFKIEYQVVNLEKLGELYPTGGDVTVSDLVAKGAVRKNEKVKVLGSGDIAVKLNVAVDKVSGSAESKIVAAGGSVK